MKHSGPRMDECSVRVTLTGKKVLHLLDEEGEDGGLDDVFFAGSDEKFGLPEEAEEM